MQPLEGIKVLEFSTMITASLAAMMMGEQGASVIKIEPIEVGDPMRFLGSSKGGISALFSNFNRGKKSVRLDIKSDEGWLRMRMSCYVTIVPVSWISLASAVSTCDRSTPG